MTQKGYLALLLKVFQNGRSVYTWSNSTKKSNFSNISLGSLTKDSLPSASRLSQFGSAPTELALSVSVFLIIIFIFFAFALHLYRQVGLQFAVADTARWASIGTVGFSPDQRRVTGTVPRTSLEIREHLKEKAKLFIL